MSQTLALGLFSLFILWLFFKDSKRPNRPSLASWVPLLWAFIVATKPASQWLCIGAVDEVGAYQDGPLDKGLFLFLIAVALKVLAGRRLDWRAIFANNKWLFIFFLYLGLSVLWAEDSFVSFKRWIKDIGNVLMVLVVLTEEDPIESIRTFFARCAYLLIPLSVLVIKYYPAISRRYKAYTDEVVFVGVTTDKNMLGMTLAVCAISIVWMLLDARAPGEKSKDKTAVLRYSLLIAMIFWLLTKAKSSTSFTCSVIGACILLGMRVPAIRRKVDRLGPYSVAVIVLFLLLQASGFWEVLIKVFVQIVGRDPSFHGRTAIWEALLKQDINPLLGVGYYSFWSPERMRKISEGYHSALNEAHNGYLETYLNSGLLGLFLLLAMLISVARSIKKAVLLGSTWGALRFAFLVANVFYAMSEAIFNRLSLLWMVLILAATEFPYKVPVEAPSSEEPLEKALDSEQPGLQPGPA